MQKALILALLIGAFLLPRYVTAQDAQCPDGGTYYEGYGCGVEAELKDVSLYRCLVQGYLDAESNYRIEAPTQAEALAACGNVGKEKITAYAQQLNACDVEISINTPYITGSYATPDAFGDCPGNPAFGGAVRPINNQFSVQKISDSQTYQCPPEDYPSFTTGPVDVDDAEMCFVSDEPPPPECDDIVGNCTPPEEDPQCFRGGAGQLVCFEDPNDKCTKNSDAQIGDPPESVYQNCQSGCGFVQGNFLCSETPDIPSLDKCLVTTNGYACPPDIPEPDDDIDNPEKPIDNMVKNDFKDVLKGVETRTDATNQLLADQIARDKENTDAINAGQGQSNAYLKQIDLNTKKIADTLEDGMKGDGVEFNSNDRSDITAALGITGDESIDDLTVNEVTLDEFRSEFTWSLGSDQCPQPRQINMLGKTFYMEWDPFCQAFNVIGLLIMAAAYFFATLIAFKGK